MGRYYNGDINGKFWFALQSSDCADRFGFIGQTPNYLQYHFIEDNLPEIEAEIQRIELFLGDKKEKIEKMYEKENGYNDQILKDYGISNYELSEYADLLLGYEIRDCVKENGVCDFDAEL